eukprot:10415016-Lingulodinium_polyedra.AAC.1
MALAQLLRDESLQVSRARVAVAGVSRDVGQGIHVAYHVELRGATRTTRDHEARQARRATAAAHT